MKAFCKFYAGNTRLLAGINSCANMPAFRMFCIEGIVHQQRNSMKIVSPTATIIVSYMVPSTKNVMMYLMSTDPKYRSKNDTVVDVEVAGIGNVFVHLLALLRDRYDNTGNNFELTLVGTEGTVVITPDSGEGACVLSAAVSGDDGEAMTMDEVTINRTVESCTAIKSFCYDAHSAEYEKSVSVRRGYSEIYREISRYLNKTICLVSLDKSGTSLIEQFISISSAVEIVTRQDGKRHYRRLNFPFPASANPFCVYVLSSSVDDIIREHGNSRRG